MCGIAGFSGPLSQELLMKMNHRQIYRGPDFQGYHHDLGHQIGLCHQRLAILDLSARGNQPMWGSAKKTLIVFSGEIYNYLELKIELEKKGHKFQTSSDTEVLLHMYDEFGESMLPSLNGMFSFAIYDFEKKILFLARDQYGVKPLYYTQSSQSFIFASELKTILLEKSVTTELNPQAIANYLQFLWAPAPLTPLKNIFKLEPGHALIVQAGKIQKKWCYYELPFEEQIQDLSVELACVQFRQYFSQAVKRQMVADVPVGAFLSGGFDSSSIAYYAREYAKEKLPCFTIGHKNSKGLEGFADDLPYARQMAKFLGVDLYEIEMGPEILSELPDMITHLDEPTADPAALNQMLISKLAHQHGLKVLLSGAGGDDLFSGYRRHQALGFEKYWSYLPLGLRKKISLTSSLLPQNGKFGRRLTKAMRYLDFGEQERLISYFYWTSPHEVLTLLNSSFYSDQEPMHEGLIEELNLLPKNTPSLNKMLYLEQKHFLTDHNLNYGDKMSMRHSVEVRVPFLDPDLVRFSWQLPVNLKLHNHIGKFIPKKAMSGLLPKEIINRPKTGFSLPLREWMHQELSPLQSDVLSPMSVARRGIFNYEEIQKLRERDRLGKTDGTYTIFALICIELWCRIFIDNRQKL